MPGRSIKCILVLLVFSNPQFLLSQIPYPRNQPVVTYHSDHKSYFLFGGYNNKLKKRTNDLWRFNQGKWKEESGDLQPQARSGHAMIYDKPNNRLVLFGGKSDSGELLSDTWIWNDAGWTQLPIVGPDARQSHRIVSTKMGVVLFGGSDQSGNSLSDTWLLNKDSWKKIDVSKPPPARRQHTLVYDENNNKTVLFGGFDRIDGEKMVLGDTWEFDGVSWEKMGEHPEIARDHHAMGYDIKTNSIIMFGGYNKGYLGDTRVWNGKDWIIFTLDGPTPRAGKPGFTYNNETESLILFGGWDATNQPLMDFWEFNFQSKSWTEL